MELAIASNNDEVGDMASPVYYDKGRQAIYQLYRSVGEEKFDQFMREYFKRYVYKMPQSRDFSKRLKMCWEKRP